MSISLIGEINLQLEFPTLPILSRDEWLRLGELGFGMAMILYSESYSSIRIFAMKHGDKTSQNRDLLALGASNLVSGLLHGMPIGAGYSATSRNRRFLLLRRSFLWGSQTSGKENSRRPRPALLGESSGARPCR